MSSVCLHRCSCVHMYIDMHMSTYRPEVDVRCCSRSLCLTLLKQSLSLVLNSLVQLDGLATYFQAPLIFLPGTRIMCACQHARHFLWVLTIQLSFSCLYGKHFTDGATSQLLARGWEDGLAGMVMMMRDLREVFLKKLSRRPSVNAEESWSGCRGCPGYVEAPPLWYSS